MILDGYKMKKEIAINSQKGGKILFFKQIYLFTTHPHTYMSNVSVLVMYLLLLKYNLTHTVLKNNVQTFVSKIAF